MPAKLFRERQPATRGSGPCWVDIVAKVDRIRAKKAGDRGLTRGCSVKRPRVVLLVWVDDDVQNALHLLELHRVQGAGHFDISVTFARDLEGKARAGKIRQSD